MPSASPQYTFSSVFAEPETPLVLTDNGSSNETNNKNINENSSSHNNNNIFCMGVNNGCLINSNMSCNISSDSSSGSEISNSMSSNISMGSGSSNTTYNPFKCLSAMAEQSLTGNFTHSSSTSNITDGSICSSRGNNSTISSCGLMTGNNYNSSSTLMNLQYPACDRNMYLALSSNSSLSSSSPPLSPSSSHCMYMSTPKLDSSSDFLNSEHSSYHKISTTTNETFSQDSIRHDSPLCHSPSTNQNSEWGVINSTRSICKKSYPSCSSEQALDESERLLSWTLQHPEGWSNREVLDWVFFVAQEHGLDMQEFRGENFQAYTGTQLCQMELEDFTRLEPKFGKIIYGMFRELLCGVVFRKPIDPDHLSSSSVHMNSYSPVISPKMSMDMQCCPQPLYQVSGVEMNDCNGMTQHTFLKQERCSSMEGGGIDIISYDFDLEDTPCLTGSQCPEQYQQEYSMYPTQYPQTTTIRTPCFPAPPFPGQLPRRRPGRPRVKSLLEDDRVSKEKKVKNQHLWEFIYETLMNPMYNPQYLRWENQRDGVFRFVQSEAVAQLWGGRKNNENMTYEKLSRAMRHYYRRGILERVEGRRLVYKFSLKAMERIRDKRNSV